jgi:hypothetical protein
VSSLALLLLAKILVSAGIVIVVTLAAERLGPRIGGLVAATPQMSVVTLVFFSLEQGRAFAAETAFWTIPGVCATIPVYLAYLAATGRVRGSAAVSIGAGAAAGVAAFAVSIAALGALPLTRATVVPFAALVCLLAARLVRRLPDTAPLARVRTSAGLLAARAGVSTAMVLTVTSLAQVLGPKWSGLVAGFPVNSLPVMAILHFHYGRQTIKPLVKLWPAGAFGICLFNLVAWLTTERLGVAATIVLGYAVDVLYLLALNRPGRRRLGGQ